MAFRLLNGIVASLLLVSSLTHAQSGSEVEAPDIRSLPRLAPGLAPGTIAWATIDQLHPTQPQTGKREVKRKRKEILELLPNHESKFPKKLYRFLFEKEIVPVFIGKTPRQDSRYGIEDALGFITDRHHGSNALADAIEKVYGERALREPIYDDKGRPINFILVKVEKDHSDLTPAAFAQLMTRENHGYLKKWRRTSSGKTVIEKITFGDTPERVTEMTDNPFRGLVGEEQHEHDLGRSPTEFSQFVDAEALVDRDVVEWDDISLDASDKKWEKAIKKAKKFFESDEAAGLPGARGTKTRGACKLLFGA